ncbi:MAG: hypothetical protein R3D98_06300 [Candidatus Krumholzibacteriia bacterium]
MTIRSVRLPAPSCRRLLVVVLLACLSQIAVPGLAHCCADRCHDAVPASEHADHCDCTLRGVEPPVDVLPLVHAPDTCAVEACPVAVPCGEPEPPRVIARTDAGAACSGPDRTTVLRI